MRGEEPGTSTYGPGFTVGAEYELKRHLLLNFDVVYGLPKPDDLAGVDRESTTLLARVTVNWLHY